MIQTLTSSEKSLASNSSARILCSYINTTGRLQIIRIKNIPDLHLERVIFPGQRLMFEAVPEAKVELQFSEKMSIFVPCHQLRVLERK